MAKFSFAFHDIERASLVVIIGGNTAESHPIPAALAEVTEALGKEPEISEVGSLFGSGPQRLPAGTVLPLVAVGLVAVIGFWIGRRT